MSTPAPYPASREGLLACLAEALELANIDLAAWPQGLTPEVSLDDDLGLDSFQLMKVARHLERAYHYQFSVADWALAEEESGHPTYSVGSLITFMLGQLGAR